MSLINYEDVVDIVFDNYNEDLEDILDLLSALPKTDIVRCKDCKYFDGTYRSCSVHRTNIHGPFFWVSEHDFCSFGERKDENED